MKIIEKSCEFKFSRSLSLSKDVFVQMEYTVKNVRIESNTFLYFFQIFITSIVEKYNGYLILKRNLIQY